MNELQQAQSPQILANLVCMLRAASDGAVWLVRNTDASRLFKPFLATESRIVVTGETTEVVSGLLAARKCRGVLTIVQLDPGEPWPIPPSFAPDEGDLDCFLLASSALEKVVAECDSVDDSSSTARAIREEFRTRFCHDSSLTSSWWHEVAGADCIRVLEERYGKNVRRDLRLALNIDDFLRSSLYLRILHWEVCEKVIALRELRERDSLGSVLDQRYWESDLEHFLRESVPTAILKADLDHFKSVNDKFGHTAGDRAIKRYCEVVRNVVARRGWVYRRGGDEVVAIVPFVSNVEAGQLAEQVRHEVQQQLWPLSADAPLTASIGLVHVTVRRDRNEILKTLDEAQSLSKRRGRNRVEQISHM
jgi:diguanylate cyclase (GGDEF)-like protein